MKLIGKLVGSAMLPGIILLNGCIDPVYTGREYPPTEITKITYYNSIKEVPETKLVRIGRCVITSPDNFNGEELKKAAMKKASEVGADAVAFYDFKKIETGTIEMPKKRGRGDSNVSGKWDKLGRSANNSPIYTDSYGSSGSDLRTTSRTVFKLRLRTLFYRDRSKEFDMPIVVKATPVPVAEKPGKGKVVKKSGDAKKIKKTSAK